MIKVKANMPPPCDLEGIAGACSDDKQAMPACYTLGFWQTWPFTYLHRRSSLCDEFLRRHPEYALKIPIDKRLDEFLGSVLERPDLTFTKYDGYVQYAFLGMMYLMQRSPNECVLFSNLDQTIKRLWAHKHESMEFVDWSDIGVLWRPHPLSKRFRASFPGGRRSYIESAKRCQKRQKKGRFILSILTLVNEIGDHHANILMYDRETRQLERFDPYQRSHPSYHTELLDPILEEVFREIDPLYACQVVPPGTDFFLGQGLQLRAEMENIQHPEDPGGFCQPWTFLYADTRMSFPSQDPAMIVRQFERMAGENKQPLTMFIRKYAQRMHEMNQEIILEYQTRLGTMEAFVDPRVPLLVLFLERLRTCQNLYT